MPEEIFIIALVAIISGTLMITGIVRSILRYLSSRHQSAQSPAGSSLTTGELEHLLRAAVQDVTAPLLAKIDALEQRFDQRGDRLLDPPSRIPDAALLTEDEVENPETAVGVRRRQPLR